MFVGNHRSFFDIVINYSILPPLMGFIAKKVVGGTIKWRVVTFKKCQFKPVDYSINTQAETVEFQTPELEATVLTPDDASSWQEWGDYNTEAAALTALQTALGT